MDAGLAGGFGAHISKCLGQFEAAGDGGVRDVYMRPGFQRHFEDFEVGHRLGQRRAGAAMHDGIGASCRSGLRRKGLHQFLIFVMDGARQAGAGDLVEGRQHGGMVDAREAHGVVFIGG